MAVGDTRNKFQAWIDNYRKSNSDTSGTILTPIEFNRTLNECADELLVLAYEKGYKEGSQSGRQNTRNKPECSISMSEFKNNPKGRKYSNLKSKLNSSHNRLYYGYTSTIQERDEILRIDWKERVRFLGFRIVTAIGIAAVVLLTAWIAHKYGIPLPLSGVKQVAAG